MTNHGWVQVGTQHYTNSYVQPGKMITINYESTTPVDLASQTTGPSTIVMRYRTTDQGKTVMEWMDPDD